MPQFLALKFVDDIVNSFKLIFTKSIGFSIFETLKSALWMLIYSIASVLLMFLDFVQDCFKKLAGLDTYYYEGTDAAFENEDILYRLLTTPEILKAFGSLVVVGIILLFLFTIIQFIRVEYTTEGAKNSKGNIIQQSLKSLLMFVIVPVASLIGIFLSNKVLQIIDNATDPSPGSTIAGNIFKISVYDANPIRAKKSTLGGFGMIQQEAVYIYNKGEEGGATVYKGPVWTHTFKKDGKEFSARFKIKNFEYDDLNVVYGFANVTKLQVYDTGETETSPTGIETSKYAIYEADKSIKFTDGSDTMEVPIVKTSEIAPNQLGNKTGEELAEAIDDMFSHRGQVKSGITTNMYTVNNRKSYFVGMGIREGQNLDYTNTFSVMYFYNMQDINYFILFVCSGFAIVCLYKAAFGMIMRLYMCAILFVISPPIIALAPMDNGKALSSWKSKFLGQVIAAYGTVVALNVFFTVLPIIEKIELFRGSGPWSSVATSFFNGLVQMVFVLVGCFMLKDVSKTISGLIGAEDAMASGEGMSKQIGAVAAKTAAVGVGLAAAGGGLAMRGASRLAGKLGTNKKVDNAHKDLAKARETATNKALAEKAGIKDFDPNNEHHMSLINATKENLSEEERKQLETTVNTDKSVTDAVENVVNVEKEQNYNGKFKSGMRKFATSSNLAGRRFTAAGGGNIKAFIANTGVGKFTKEALGDFAPTAVGGKGLGVYRAHDAEIASKNDVLKQMVDSDNKAYAQRKEDESVNGKPIKLFGKEVRVGGMGSINKVAQHEADRAVMEQAASRMVAGIEAGARQATQEVEKIRKEIIQVVKDIQSGLLDKNKGTEQMIGMYQSARDKGLLTDKSENTLSNMISAYKNHGMTENALISGLKLPSTLESKYDVTVNMPGIKADLDTLKAEINAGNIQAVGKISNILAEKLKAQGLKIDSLGDVLNKIANEASQSKKDEKEMKKLLGILGNLSKK